MQDTALLAIYVDGIVVDPHHIVAAIGMHEPARKHLLSSLNKRGVRADLPYLFVIDGAKVRWGASTR